MKSYNLWIVIEEVDEETGEGRDLESNPELNGQTYQVGHFKDLASAMEWAEKLDYNYSDFTTPSANRALIDTTQEVTNILNSKNGDNKND